MNDRSNAPKKNNCKKGKFRVGDVIQVIDNKGNEGLIEVRKVEPYPNIKTNAKKR